MRQKTAEWLEFAKRYLHLARYCAEEAQDPVNALFHAQQAVENCLKALIQERQKDPPERTHDLERLAVIANLWSS
jgi:HEPN domain-containing protein